MSVQIGKCYRTPWEPSGVVRVLSIVSESDNIKETCMIEFVGDHPQGYRDGSIGRYPTDELEGREVCG